MHSQPKDTSLSRDNNIARYKLSPSDFAYLYNDCKLCYWLKIKHKVKLPSMPMPGVFSTMNSIVQGDLVGKNLREISADLPEGKIIKQEGFVKSNPIEGTNVFISGKYDLLVENPDGTHMIVDLKISKPSDEKSDMYKSQLWSYKYALENPQDAEPLKITKLALLIFYPDSVKFEDGVAKVMFPPQWVEVDHDEAGFIKLMKEVDDLLAGPPPTETEKCQWCNYRHIGEKFSHYQE